MATFILVHGAYHGGWCWEKVVPRLVALGHIALAPDLPGNGSDPIPARDVTLAVTGEFISELARQQGAPVILVGHSFGGVVISEAAERSPELFTGLVYVSGVLLADGMAAQDLMGGDDPLPAGVSANLDDTLRTVSADRATARYYQDCSADDVRRAVTRLRQQPTRPMRDKLKVTAERFGKVPRGYIECVQDQAIPLTLQRSLQRAMPCRPIFTMDTGHAPFLRAPDALTDNLISAATAFD